MTDLILSMELEIAHARARELTGCWFIEPHRISGG